MNVKPVEVFGFAFARVVANDRCAIERTGVVVWFVRKADGNLLAPLAPRDGIDVRSIVELYCECRLVMEVRTDGFFPMSSQKPF